MFRPARPVQELIGLEKELLAKWYESGVVQEYLHKNDSVREKFSFLDGPITANNPMGVHHAWGRTYKDFWQRYWNMKGKRQRFQNGFDEQGLWVEVEVEKELGLSSKRDIENLIPGDTFKSLEKFINLCKERVAKFSGIQTEQSKRLGYFMDWENSYHTSSSKNNYAIWNFLKVVHEKGWLYKGRDSVPWCPRCGTAISQHEILTEEYKLLTHRTVIFKLKIKNRNNEYLLAWTTTPWTIPGNVALAVASEFSYWKAKAYNGDIYYFISPEMKGEFEISEMLVNKFKIAEGLEKVDVIKGKDLIGLTYEAPYDSLSAVSSALSSYEHRVVEADPLILPINPSEGTGIVHVAPGAGSEDFRLGKKEKLPFVEEIDENGVFLEGFDFISRLPVKEASKKILENLEKNNFSYKIVDYTHRYPTCWRCKTELVWRVVDEWYIAMDRSSSKGEDGNRTYRQMMKEVAKGIKWMPSWGLDRELDWLSNMHDWLISKKRYWGLALPIWECDSCNAFYVIGSEDELNKKAVSGFEDFKGHTPHRPWIDKIQIKCSKCKKNISRIADVGNPWLDAGIVPFSTMPDDFFPADFITESFPGQFKNWFYSLIAMSTALVDRYAFKRVLGFASVRDEKGEEMHKSKGNAIEFNEAADKIGVDVMRWLYLRTNPEHNVSFGYHVADEVRRYFHLRFWNVYSFFVMYANADKWEVTENFAPVKGEIKNILDRWILSRLQKNIQKLSESIELYKANEAVWFAEDYVINDLSNWYVRRIRDRIGVASDETDKNQAYQTLWYVLTQYCRALSPFIPFMTDEIYTNLTSEKSVHLSSWPTFESDLVDELLEEQMLYGIELSSQVHSFRKANKLKVRIPLREISYKGPSELDGEILKIVCEETNLYKLVYKGGENEYSVSGSTDDKNLDLVAGRMREIIRQIQEERKRLGTRITELVDVQMQDWPDEFTEEIKRKSLIRNIIKGDKFMIQRFDEKS